MKTMTFIIIALTITATFLIIINKKPLKSKYYEKRPLSQPEQAMYWKLIKALPECVVLAQVNFGSFIYTKGGTAKENYINFNKMKQKRADFLICNKDFKIIAAVELDDSSHNKEKDEKRDKALMEAGIATIRWNVGNLPGEKEIKEKVDRLKASTAVNMEPRQHDRGKKHENDQRLPGRDQGKVWTQLRLQIGQVPGVDNNGDRILPEKKKHDG